MSLYTPSQLAAYWDGLDAAHRVGPYEGLVGVPECPHPTESPEGKAWWEGFGDGTEDLIAWQRTLDE